MPLISSFGTSPYEQNTQQCSSMAAGAAARLLARLFGLAPAHGRVLAFSFGTRNSFVVLPLALALPPSFEQTAVVIVFQSLVELFGMIVYLWWVPGRLFPMPPHESTKI